MKIKPTAKREGVIVELNSGDNQIFPAPLCAEMFDLKTILVPVDFSDCSLKALAYARFFARIANADLLLVHVIEPYPTIPEEFVVDLETAEQKQLRLNKICAQFVGPLRCRGLVRNGPPHAELLAAARQHAADLIVISTHGRKGFDRVVLGSTTEKVVRHAPCPVLVVRESEREFLCAEGDTPGEGQHLNPCSSR